MTTTHTTNGKPPTADLGEITRSLNLFSDNGVVELRHIGIGWKGRKETNSGYFDDLDRLANLAADCRTGNVYITLNPVERALLARRANRVDSAGTDEATPDKHITARRRLLVDFDAKRPSNISASADEHDAAIERAKRAGKALVDIHGFPKPVLADSGNGAHLLFKIDLPNDPEAEALVKRVLARMGDLFGDEVIGVDQTVSNAARISKLYGTVAAKGDHTHERPHRLSRLLFVPEPWECVTREQLEAFAGPPVDSTPPKGNAAPSHGEFSVESFLAAHVDVVKDGPYTGKPGAVHKWELRTCPLCGESDGSAVVMQFDDGRLGYKCHHDRCFGRGWQEFREHFEPGYRDRWRGDYGGNDRPGMEDLRPDDERDFGDAPGQPRQRAKAKPRVVAIDPYHPFPVDVLPRAVGDYISAAATAIGCDSSFIGLPTLACLARAIGNARVVRLKRTWTEPAIIWAAIIGKSGTSKTPALMAATQFLQKRQAEAIDRYKDAMHQYEQDKAVYERNYADWKKQKNKTEPPPWAPDEPACTRYITTDVTIEALADRLASQFDGILIPRDELSGWLGGMAEYKGGKGSDLGHWLAVWSGAPLTVDRKTGAKKMLHVPRANVSIVGGIQPGVLRSAIGREHMQDGLCARLLMAMPDSRPVVWTDDVVDEVTEAAMGEVFNRLLSLEPAADPEGNPEPYPLPLTPEAKAVWIDFYNRHRAELAGLDDDLAAAWSKLEAYAARFALIFQLCSWAAGEAGGDEVDQSSVEAGITLADWFGHEAKRVYGLFVESDTDRDARELVDLIRRKGGRVTARDLAHSSRRYRGAGEAEAALDGLVQAGVGTWEVTSTSTNQRREFVLNPAQSGNGFDESPGNT